MYRNLNCQSFLIGLFIPFIFNVVMLGLNCHLILNFHLFQSSFPFFPAFLKFTQTFFRIPFEFVCAAFEWISFHDVLVSFYQSNEVEASNVPLCLIIQPVRSIIVLNSSLKFYNNITGHHLCFNHRT
jgi:hypothetical protein